MTGAVSPFEDRIATAVAGASSFFGPLVVVAVAVDERSSRALSALGLRKQRWWSHERIRERALDARRIVPFEQVRLSPRRYNELTAKGKNRKDLELWACKKAVEAMLERYPEKGLLVCSVPEVDRAAREGGFAGARHVRQVTPWGDDGDVALATAMVLAKGQYLEDLEALSDKVGMSLDTDASTVVDRARALFHRHGWDGLREAGKLVFRLTREVTGKDPF